MPEIAVLTLEQVQQIAKEAYDAGRAESTPDEFLTVEEAAAFAKVSEGLIRYHAAQGTIPCVNFGTGKTNQFRFTKAALLAWAAKGE